VNLVRFTEPPNSDVRERLRSSRGLSSTSVVLERLEVVRTDRVFSAARTVALGSVALRSRTA